MSVLRRAGAERRRLLGDLGAEVIKIEPPSFPDPLRTWGEAELHGHHFFWMVHACNKKAVTLNPRLDAGREVFLDLVECSDVIVENFGRAPWRSGTLAVTFCSNAIRA
jgi:crotonobetainyl-CoA:carnitine CoA-transferase CaiB-like acyl-CoA transferase